MPARERVRAIAAARGERLLRELARTGWEARVRLGLSRSALAHELGISASKLARWEHGQHPLPDIREAGRWIRSLGLDLSVRYYPVGGALRDAGHATLVARFVAILPAQIPRTLEAPIPRERDLRAWDVLIEVGSGSSGGSTGRASTDGTRRVSIGVAAETRLRDFQDLLRREQLKARDGGVDRLLLVLADTRWNRHAVREAGDALRAALPLDGRTVRAALRANRDPGANGMLLL